MLKNKTIFKSIAVALIMFMMVAALSPSVGMVYAAHDPQNTQVEYSVGETEWEFSVPAAQDFNKNVELYGEVAIRPVDANGVIVLPNNQTISITFAATNGYNNTDNAFELRNGTNSAIPYQIGKVTDVSAVDGSKVISYYTQNENNNVLTYIAGNTDYSNKGISSTMAFTTTPANIQKAKVTGPHTDTLTFTVNVTGGTSGGSGTGTPTIRSFSTINNMGGSKSYEYELGMTWAEWIDSNYNTDGWKTMSGIVQGCDISNTVVQGYIDQFLYLTTEENHSILADAVKVTDTISQSTYYTFTYID